MCRKHRSSIKRRKTQRLRERRGHHREFIFLPLILLPACRPHGKKVMPTDGEAVPRMKDWTWGSGPLGSLSVGLRPAQKQTVSITDDTDTKEGTLMKH